MQKDKDQLGKQIKRPKYLEGFFAYISRKNNQLRKEVEWQQPV